MNPARSRPPNHRSLRSPPIRPSIPEAAPPPTHRRFLIKLREIFVDSFYLLTTMRLVEPIERNRIMALLWMIATFAFVAAVLGTVAFGVGRMFFIAPARERNGRASAVKAAALVDLDSGLALHDLPAPEPGDRELLV